MNIDYNNTSNTCNNQYRLQQHYLTLATINTGATHFVPMIRRTLMGKITISHFGSYFFLICFYIMIL